MNEHKLEIFRVINAPRNIVWKAWTIPEMLMHWCAPKTYTSPVYNVEFRVGGRFLSCMRSPDGKDYWSTGVYREIIEKQKIVNTDSFADEQGKPVNGSYYGMGENLPDELLVTIAFEDYDMDKTLLKLLHEGFSEKEELEMTRLGWNECLDKLDEYLEKFIRN